MASVSAAAGGPFAYSEARRARMSEARKRAECYDVYQEFPELPDLIQQCYTPGNILVTGVAGFIASHVAIRLVRLYPQYRVVGVDKLSYCSDERNVAVPLRGCPNFRFVIADVCDYGRVLQLMEEERIDTVLHLAAQSHVDLSFREGGAQQFVRDNIQGTAALLDAARRFHVRRFVHCSTDEVYGEGSLAALGRVRFTEGSQLRPCNPYSASKAGADVLVQSFHTSFGLPVIVTRGSNCYGPHQFYEKLIPKFVAQLTSGRKVTVHGDGHNTRNFLHVQDTASAFDAVLHCANVGETYNIGGRSEKSVLDVAADLLLIMGLDGRHGELVQFVPDRAHNDACYPITSDKLLALGWREQISWEFGLANTAAFCLKLLLEESRDLAPWIEAHPSYDAGPAPAAAAAGSAAACLAPAAARSRL